MLNKKHKRPDSSNHIPSHVAVIMDGNGRWAVNRGLPRAAGHKKGAETIGEILAACEELGISYLTLYAFSSENWKRSLDEVSDLMHLLRFYIKKELSTLHKKNIKLNIIGDKSKLDNDIIELIEAAENLTKENNRLVLNIALSYGSRQEIINAVQEILSSFKNELLPIIKIDEAFFSQFLYTKNLPDPDFLIRTGGEKRLSNFLLWQLAYTEFYFTEKLWPDFLKQDFIEAIEDYTKRERTYGIA